MNYVSSVESPKSHHGPIIDNPFAIRSITQVAKEYRRRHGKPISRTLVCMELRSAQRKMRAALRSVWIT